MKGREARCLQVSVAMCVHELILVRRRSDCADSRGIIAFDFDNFTDLTMPNMRNMLQIYAHILFPSRASFKPPYPSFSVECT